MGRFDGEDENIQDASILSGNRARMHSVNFQEEQCENFQETQGRGIWGVLGGVSVEGQNFQAGEEQKWEGQERKKLGCFEVKKGAGRKEKHPPDFLMKNFTKRFN